MSQIVDDLRKWADAGNPEGFLTAEEMRPLLRAAADRIEYLEGLAGAVSQGDGDFRSIARDLPRNEPKASS
jgi:hypothetical protein